MGLITKEVEVTIHGRNIEWFKNKGYEINIPKNKNGQFEKSTKKITVNVEELMTNSHVYVNVECDICGKVTNMRYEQYNKSKKCDGKYYCIKCFQSAKNGFKKILSFEEWCIENNRYDILDMWDYKLNNKLPSEITYKTTESFYFECHRKIHPPILTSIKRVINLSKNNILCKKCSSVAQYLIDLYGDNALNLYWDYTKNIVNPWSITKGSHTKIWIYCQEKIYHESYETMCSNFMKGNRCTYCSAYKIHAFDSLGGKHPQVVDIWGDKNEKSPFEFNPNTIQEVWWKCKDKKHQDYYRGIHTSNSLNFRCPRCKISKGEAKIEEYLELNKIKFQSQMTYLNLVGLMGKNLSYDFYLPEYAILIEYQGEQHERPVDFNSFGKKFTEKQFKKQQEHDRRKREYAKENNIDLLEIWYYDFDRIEEILDKKIRR